MAQTISEPRVDELRGRTKLKGKPGPEQLEELQRVKAELKTAEEELATAETERDDLALRVPNAPADDVPDGATEDDAREVRRVGELADLSEPRDHLELGRFDMERAARRQDRSRPSPRSANPSITASRLERDRFGLNRIQPCHPGSAKRYPGPIPQSRWVAE